MKSQSGRLIRLLFVAFFLFCPFSESDADTIVLAADYWCPYNCQPGAEEEGYMVDVAREVFESKGHRVEYQIVPWSGAVDGGKMGRFSGIIGATRVDGEGFVFPDEECGISSNDFFVLKAQTWKYATVDSLTNIRLGVIKDYDYGETLNAYIQKNSKTEAMSIQAVSWSDAVGINLEKLVNGRIDVVLDDRNVILFEAKKMKISDKIMPAGNDGSRQPIYVAFSPQNPKSKEYAAIFTDGLWRLRKSGKLKEILAKYGLDDWKK